MDVITDLLETHGQGGSCMEDECEFTYHNSFLISDRKEAWLLETSGKYWAAERVDGKKENLSSTIRFLKAFKLYLAAHI